MKRFFIFFILLFSTTLLLVSLPATDARFLNIEISYHLQSDGSWDMEYSHQVRLDTYYAVNRALGETFIVYNPDFQKLEILKAETTMADGRKVAAPDNAFNEVLPFAAHGFPDFSHLREMVVTHTGLERGAIVDLRYRIHTKPGFLPGFSGREELARAFPVDSFKLTLIVPAGQDLRYRFFGLKAEAEVSASGAEKRYAFALAAMKAAAHEPLAPAGSEPAIIFSATVDWRRVLELKEDPSPLSAALVAKVEKLKAQYPVRADLLAALQKTVAVDVRNCGLGSDKAGWQPRPPERVFASNYGTGLEKALLLQAMLQKVGIEAELLAVAAGADFAPDVPTLLQVGEYWLKIVAAEQISYLDPCREQYEFYAYRCQGLAAFNLERQELEKFPVVDQDQNKVEISGTVVLDPTAAQGILTVMARGIYNRYPEAVESNSKFIEGLLKKIFPVQKVEIKKLLLLTPREIRAEVTFSGPWLKDAGAGLFSVDPCRLPGLSENMVQTVKRELPLALEAPFKISLELDLQPAAGLSLEYGAPDVQIKNETGSFLRSLRPAKDGHLSFSQSCVIEMTPIGPDFYPRLRELLRAYYTPDLWLVLKKDK
jgi:hypothetical protein